jgi:hypothetical protein
MKLRLSSVFEQDKYLETESGQELKGMIDFFSEFTQQVVQGLTGQLTYGDNFAIEEKRIRLKSGQVTTVKTDTNRRVKEIRARKLISDTFFTMTSWGWKYNTDGQAVVRIHISGQPHCVLRNVPWTKSGSGPWTITMTSGGHMLANGVSILFEDASTTNAGGINQVHSITVISPDQFYFETDIEPTDASGTLTYEASEYFDLDIITYY